MTKFKNKTSDKLETSSARDNWIRENRIPLFVQHLKNRENIDLTEQKAFEFLCAADTSTNHSAVQWIIDSYLRNGFLLEDLIGGKLSKVWDTLNLFGRFRQNLDPEQRSLYTYKTLGELYNSVESYVQSEQNAIEENLDSVGKQLKQQEKQAALANTRTIVDQTTLKIVVPLTEEASKWWGKGTRWCTAAKNNNQFDYYNEYGPLLIMLFKDHENRSRKFQLYVNETDLQWMDEKDMIISLDFIEKNWSILEFVVGSVIKTNGLALDCVPEQFRTKELCAIGCNSNAWAIRCVPEKFITEQLCKIVCEKNGYALQCVPDRLKTREICWIACENTGMALEHVPKVLRTKELCQIACEQTADALRYVPEKFKTKELCWMTSQKTGSVFHWVPEKFKTEDFYYQMIKSNPLSLRFVPDNFQTKSLCAMAIQQNGEALAFIPPKFKDKKLCWTACEQTATAIKYLSRKMIKDRISISSDERSIVYDICKKACEKDGLILYNLPLEIKDRALCKAAVQSHGTILIYVPDRFKDHELCMLACVQDIEALNYVPKLIKTKDFVENVNKIKQQNSKKSWDMESIKKIFVNNDILCGLEF